MVACRGRGSTKSSGSLWIECEKLSEGQIVARLFIHIENGRQAELNNSVMFPEGKLCKPEMGKKFAQNPVGKVQWRSDCRQVVDRHRRSPAGIRCVLYHLDQGRSTPPLQCHGFQRRRLGKKIRINWKHQQIRSRVCFSSCMALLKGSQRGVS